MKLRIIAKFGIVLAALSVLACGGLHFSQADPTAQNFHPRHIAVFPVDVTAYEGARLPMEQIVPGVLMETKWFADVTDTASLNRQISSNEELRKAMTEYLSKLNTLNFSDAGLSRKIGETIKADAFLLAAVDYWSYTVEKDKNFAKVSIGMRLIDAATGKIMWKAGHRLSESYVLIKPDLSKVARKVVREMIDEMPH